MDRRDFLKMFGAGLALATAPKFIFDMGANLYKAEQGLYYQDRLFFTGDHADTYLIKWKWISNEDIECYHVEGTINPMDQGIFSNLTV